MTKTTLEFTGNAYGDLWVIVTSTKSLTEKEKDQVAIGIQRAISWCFDDEDLPDVDEVKEALTNRYLADILIDICYTSNPEIAKKTSI